MNVVDQFKYLKALEREFGRQPKTLKLFAPTGLISQPFTSDEKAFKGIPWIDYWCAAVNYTGNVMRCARCGKEIYAHLPQGADDDMQAHGGHVLKAHIIPAQSFDFKSYITPLCRKCNNAANAGLFHTKAFTVLVEIV